MTQHDGSPRLFWGKYRGKVSDNTDAKGLGRIKVQVPGVTGDVVLQALPCTPYAGPRVGFFMLPPVGANVWIEFEGGDLNFPIWSGCFWGDGAKEDALPPTDARTPEVKVLQTDTLVLLLDDQNGRLTAKLKARADKGGGQTVSLVMDDNGIVLDCRQVTVTITRDHIELRRNQAIVEVTDQIELRKPTANVMVANGVQVNVGASAAEWSQSAIKLSNGAASVALSPASVNINNGALEIT